MSLDQLEEQMTNCWEKILSSDLAGEIQQVLSSGDKKLYELWLSQVAHLTQHTSAHQALVATRINEVSHVYMKFCYEHALEEVGHEMMALSDLKKIGCKATHVVELPPPLAATEKLNAYLYYIATKANPLTRLGFSYWAEKCYPFIQNLANCSKEALGLDDHQMTFFVSHATIDERHADDVERIIQVVCQKPEDWAAVETGMVNSLNMAINIFEEIYAVVNKDQPSPEYEKFLNQLTNV